MNARIMMSFCSYASRRAGSDLLALMGAPAVIRNAHGNWKTADVARIAGTEMADVYTEEKEMASAKAKTLVARTIQLAIKRLNRTDFRGATFRQSSRKRTETRSWTRPPGSTQT